MWTTENRCRYDRSHLRYESDLTDEEWREIEPQIPPGKRGGNKRTVNIREVVNGIMYILSTGCQWHALPRSRAGRNRSFCRSSRGFDIASPEQSPLDQGITIRLKSESQIARNPSPIPPFLQNRLLVQASLSLRPSAIQILHGRPMSEQGPDVAPGGEKMRVTYRVLPRTDSPTCDVQVVEEGGKSRLVHPFNCEADAWEWVTDQE